MILFCVIDKEEVRLMSLTNNIVYIEDLSALGKNINEIVKSIEDKFNAYETVEIEGFCTVTCSEKDIVLGSMKLLLQANSKLWSRSGKKSTQAKSSNRRKALTDEQEKDVLDMVQNGCRRADIAKKYSISVVTVSRILKSYNVKMESGRPKVIL